MKQKDPFKALDFFLKKPYQWHLYLNIYWKSIEDLLPLNKTIIFFHPRPQAMALSLMPEISGIWTDFTLLINLTHFQESNQVDLWVTRKPIFSQTAQIKADKVAH